MIWYAKDRVQCEVCGEQYHDKCKADVTPLCIREDPDTLDDCAVVSLRLFSVSLAFICAVKLHAFNDLNFSLFRQKFLWSPSWSRRRRRQCGS